MLLTAEAGSRCLVLLRAAMPAALFKLCFGCWSANGTCLWKLRVPRLRRREEEEKKKRVKFWKSERGSQNVEILSASVASCVWCIRDFPSSISKHRSPIILVGVQRLSAAFQGEIAASSVTNALGLTLFQQVLEWKQDFAARGRKKKNP